jgi:hypothetical protein
MIKKEEPKKTKLPVREKGIPYLGESVQFLRNKIEEAYKGCNNRILDFKRTYDIPVVAEQTTGVRGNDGYGWFGELEFKLNDTRVAVLFPRSNPITHKMQRPIEVYVHYKGIKSMVKAGCLYLPSRVDILLENLANEFYNVMQAKNSSR